MPETIVIRSADSRDILPEETGDLAEAVRKWNGDFDVLVEGGPKGRMGRCRITWSAVLTITLLGEVFVAGKAFAEEVGKKVADVKDSKLDRAGLCVQFTPLSSMAPMVES